MFQKLKEKKQKALRWLFGSLTATSLMFVFQACYGMPNDEFLICIQGQVVSERTGQPIPNIEVKSLANTATVLTDEQGYFDIDIPFLEDLGLSFRDIDQAENGRYATLDTVFKDYSGESVLIRMKSIRDGE